MPHKLSEQGISSAYEEQYHDRYRKPRKRRAYPSHNPNAETHECGWFKLQGKCRYGDDCKYQHTEMSSE